MNGNNTNSLLSFLHKLHKPVAPLHLNDQVAHTLEQHDHIRPVSRCAFHHGAYSSQKNLTLGTCEVDLRTINTLLADHQTMFTQDSSIFPR